MLSYQIRIDQELSSEMHHYKWWWFFFSLLGEDEASLNANMIQVRCEHKGKHEDNWHRYIRTVAFPVKLEGGNAQNITVHFQLKLEVSVQMKIQKLLKTSNRRKMYVHLYSTTRLAWLLATTIIHKNSWLKEEKIKTMWGLLYH